MLRVRQGFPTVFWPDTPQSLLVDRWHLYRSWSKFQFATNVAGNQISVFFCTTSRKQSPTLLDLGLTPQWLPTPQVGNRWPTWNNDTQVQARSSVSRTCRWRATKAAASCFATSATTTRASCSSRTTSSAAESERWTWRRRRPSTSSSRTRACWQSQTTLWLTTPAAASASTRRPRTTRLRCTPTLPTTSSSTTRTARRFSSKASRVQRIA